MAMSQLPTWPCPGYHMAMCPSKLGWAPSPNRKSTLHMTMRPGTWPCVTRVRTASNLWTDCPRSQAFAEIENAFLLCHPHCEFSKLGSLSAAAAAASSSPVEELSAAEEWLRKLSAAASRVPAEPRRPRRYSSIFTCLIFPRIFLSCFSPLWVAFAILIGGFLLDVLISVSLVSALPVDIIIADPTPPHPSPASIDPFSPSPPYLRARALPLRVSSSSRSLLHLYSSPPPSSSASSPSSDPSPKSPSHSPRSSRPRVHRCNIAVDHFAVADEVYDLQFFEEIHRIRFWLSMDLIMAILLVLWKLKLRPPIQLFFNSHEAENWRGI
ncbi:uncharacterized protein LOC109717972 [Ananas comosus]|uniref:Uncharacterized protein LOC109717972 n=1 Tax=Ananas comosus TaxID=4615 RepID=A0A6P5G1I6_ANACO|nr:uncharacterized protein LOC109717972 [Ananas comosus]